MFTSLNFPPSHPLIIARTQVSLPDGAFIRVLPLAVEEKQRFRMDAIVLCADIIASAYEQMIETALRSIWEQTPFVSTGSRRLDIAVIQHCWSIVDQLYSLRKLFQILEIKEEAVDLFMFATECVYELRNRMDHLHSRIPNIVASSNMRRSLFGGISYFIQGSAAGHPKIDVLAVTHHAEPIRPGEVLVEWQVPSEARLPIGNFALNAAGVVFDIDAAILTLGRVMIRVNELVEKNVRAHAAEMAAERGVSVNELLAHFGAGLKVVMPLKVNEGHGFTQQGEFGWAMMSTPSCLPLPSSRETE